MDTGTLRILSARWLQWGRNLIVAEGQTQLRVSTSQASLQWGRNLIVAEGCQVTAEVFQGRALQWGRNLIVAEGEIRRAAELADSASMGPQLDSCGRADHCFSSRMRAQLQWGRNLIVAEGRAPRCPAALLRGFNGAAT